VCYLPIRHAATIAAPGSTEGLVPPSLGRQQCSIGRLNRCRRLVKSWECLNRNVLAFLRWGVNPMMVKKLCQKKYDLG
jgi:hypothetical protein